MTPSPETVDTARWLAAWCMVRYLGGRLWEFEHRPLFPNDEDVLGFLLREAVCR